MSTTDRINEDLESAAKARELLAFLTTPHTTEEVALEFNWHDQTARNKIWALRDLGKVKKMPRKRGRKDVWQTIGSLGDHGEVIVVTNGGSALLHKYLVSHSGGRRKGLGDAIAECLAYVWRRAYYKQQDQDSVLNVAAQGTLDPLLHIRTALETVYLGHKHYIEVLEKLLLDLPELWQDGNPAILKMFGDLTLEQTEGILTPEFELWVLQVLERR